MSEKPGVIFLRDGTQIAIPCEAKHISDGFHSFNELYDHRCLLFVALMKAFPKMSWRSLRHEDGSFHEGWFIAGMRTPKGDISYHLPESMYFMLENIETRDRAPKWDGHTSADVIDRISDWVVDGVW